MSVARLVYATFDDGVRTLLHTVASSFDVEEWARSREESFRLLGIIEITYEDV